MKYLNQVTRSEAPLIHIWYTVFMPPKLFYHFCPKCGGQLQANQGNSLTCTACKFVVYINSAAAVGALIENQQGEILLVTRKDDPGKGLVDVPGGFLQPGESIEQALAREVHEELAITIQITGYVGSFPLEYPFQGLQVPMCGIFMTAKLVDGNPMASDDAASFAWVPKAQLQSQKYWDESIKKGVDVYLSMNNY